MIAIVILTPFYIFRKKHAPEFNTTPQALQPVVQQQHQWPASPGAPGYSPGAGYSRGSMVKSPIDRTSTVGSQPSVSDVPSPQFQHQFVPQSQYPHDGGYGVPPQGPNPPQPVGYQYPAMQELSTAARDRELRQM